MDEGHISNELHESALLKKTTVFPSSHCKSGLSQSTVSETGLSWVHGRSRCGTAHGKLKAPSRVLENPHDDGKLAMGATETF